MTIDTQKLRDLTRRAVPLPWILATSNSWRRILSRDGAAVCSPCSQSDGHPDLHFPGGPEGPTATLLIEAANTLPGLLDHIDAQTAEIARLRVALRWTAATLQDATASVEMVFEEDHITLEGETKTVAQILDAADAALVQHQGEKNG